MATDIKAAGAAAAPHAGVPLPMLIGIVVGVALLVGGGSVAAVMMLRPPAAVTEEVAAADPALEGEESGEAYLVIEDPFIVNLKADPQFPYQYLKFAVSLEVADEKMVETLSEKLPKIKATINGLMNNVSYAEISSEDGQKQFGGKIKSELNAELGPLLAAEGEGKDKKAAEEPETVIFAAYFTTLVAQ